MITKKSIWNCLWMGLLVGFLSLVLMAPAMAQKTAEGAEKEKLITEMSADEIGQHATGVITKINSLYAVGKHYTAALKDASPEDRLVLELQIASLRTRMADSLQKLGDALLELEKSAPQPELRQQVEKIYPEAVPRIWFHVDHLSTEIDKLRNSRTKAKPDERYNLEYEIAKLTRGLDETYNIALRHLQKMEALGMEVEDHLKALIQRLYARTEELSGRISLAQVRIDEYEARSKDFPDDADAAKLLKAATKSLATNTDSMQVVLDLMDELDLDTETQRSDLMTITQDLSAGLTDTGVVIRLVKRSLANVTSWLVEKGPGFVVKLILVVIIILLFRVATRILRAGLNKAIDASSLEMSQLAHRMLVNTASHLVMLFGILLALSQLGITLGPLLAGLGVAGFIVGFALQDTLGNFASGLMILIYRPYDVGDLVDVGGVFGKVHKMTLVSTTLLTLDNQAFVVPNTKIWGDVIKNVTAQKLRRVDMVFGIAYTDDIPKAEKILEDILKKSEMVLADPEPMVRLHTLGESSVDFIVRPWVKVDDYWDVYWDVTRTVKLRFDEEGISIPFPQRDVHIYHEDQAASATEPHGPA